MRLIDIGADVNTQNSFGYTPLLEACRRGYTEIVRCLALTCTPDEASPRRRKLNPDLFPDSDIYLNSPFACAAPQAPLAEAVRAGFVEVAEVLLAHTNVNINQVNNLGWTALHEACFYNREAAVRLLLKCNCKTNLRTKTCRALPYHLTNSQAIRELLAEQGGKEAIPAAHDTVDMLEILEEMAAFQVSKSTLPSSEEDPYASPSKKSQVGSTRSAIQSTTSSPLRSGRRHNMDDEDDGDDDADDGDYNRGKYLDKFNTGLSLHPANPKFNNTYEVLDYNAIIDDERGQNYDEAKYMNDDRHNSSNLYHREYMSDINKSTAHDKSATSEHRPKPDSKPDKAAASLTDLPGLPGMKRSSNSGKGKEGDNTNRRQMRTKIPADMKDVPKQFLCDLSHKLMTAPVRSVYGQHYEDSVITHWIETHGKICPITGAPLSTIDLTPQPELAQAITEYILEKASLQDRKDATPVTRETNTVTTNKATDAKAEEDLYAF